VFEHLQDKNYVLHHEHPNVPLGVDVVDELDIRDEGVTVEIVDPRRHVGEPTEPAEGIYVKDEDPAVDQMRRDSLNSDFHPSQS